MTRLFEGRAEYVQGCRTVSSATPAHGVVTWALSRRYHSVIALLSVYGFFAYLDAPGYDDSYFFKRFALNFLEHGVFAWNVADGPVHGSTSQLFQAIATLVSALVPEYHVIGVKVFNAACFFGLGWGLVDACEQAAADSGALLLCLVALTSPVLLAPLYTGMETALALLLLCLCLRWMVRLLEERPLSIGRSEHLAALFTALVYLCRPDAALIPGAFFVLSNVLQRRVPWRYVVTLGALMGVLLLLFRWYYGTALPLPFYVKTQATHALDWQAKLIHMGTVLSFAAPFCWLAWRRADAITRSLFAAAALFVLYHGASTDEVMGYQGRFYAPSLVPLVLASARSWRTFLYERRRVPTVLFLLLWAAFLVAGYRASWIPNMSDPAEQIPWPAYAGAAIAGAAILLMSLLPVERRWRGIAIPVLALGLVGWLPPQDAEWRDDQEMVEVYASRVTTLRGIFDVARCLPDAQNVYHSEMGVAGVVLMRARVVDMVGLLSEEVALAKRPFQEYCSRDRPEAIFLPNPSYGELTHIVSSSRCLKGYTRMVRSSATPLFVRKDLADSFRACAKDIWRWR